MNVAVGTATSVMKSVSEGELGVEEEVKRAEPRGAARLKRTFTLPRNPFQNASNRMSRRRPKQQQQQQQQQASHCADHPGKECVGVRNNATEGGIMQQQQYQQHQQQQRQNANTGRVPHGNQQIVQDCQERQAVCGKKVFRRPSWRKFINKMVRHMSNVGVQGHKAAAAGGGPPPPPPPPRRSIINAATTSARPRGTSGCRPPRDPPTSRPTGCRAS